MIDVEVRANGLVLVWPNGVKLDDVPYIRKGTKKLNAPGAWVTSWLYLPDLRHDAGLQGTSLNVVEGREELLTLIARRRELLALKVGDGLKIPESWWRDTFDPEFFIKRDNATGIPWPHQMCATEFLLESRRVLLADDVGLGKTLPPVAVLLKLREMTPDMEAVVITTASAKWQWRAEIREMVRPEVLRDARILVVEGEKSCREALYGQPAFLKILNYHLVPRDKVALKALFARATAVILDEGSKIKNRGIKTSLIARREVEKAGVPYRFALTATPLQNRLDEIWSIMNFLDPTVLRGFTDFAKMHMDTCQMVSCWRCKRPYPVEWEQCGRCKARTPKKGGRRFLSATGLKNVKLLKGRIAEYSIRRTKDDLGWETPQKTEVLYWVDLDADQRAEYQQQVVGKEDDHIFSLISRATQIALALDFKIDPLPRKMSPKEEEVMRLLKEDLADEKVLIFTTSQKFVRRLEARIWAAKIGGVDVIDGKVRVRDREAIKNSFNEGNTRILIANEAAEHALNLQGGNVVVNLDLPWNPEHYKQRVGRIRPDLGGKYRMIRLVTILARDTWEERMHETVRDKLGLFSAVWGDHGVDMSEVFSRKAMRRML